MGDITREELQRIVENAVHNAVRQALDDMKPVSNKEWYSFKEAIKYMSENGLILSESQLYKLTSQKAIPVRKAGKRLTFCRSDLNKYIKLNVKESIDASLTDASRLLAKSARAKCV